jgi:hypothetical protein
MQDQKPKARRRVKDFRRHELLLPLDVYDRLRGEAERRCMPLNVLIRLALEPLIAATERRAA